MSPALPFLLSKHLVNLSKIFKCCPNWRSLPAHLSLAVKILGILMHKVAPSLQPHFIPWFHQMDLIFCMTLSFQVDRWLSWYLHTQARMKLLSSVSACVGIQMIFTLRNQTNKPFFFLRKKKTNTNFLCEGFCSCLVMRRALWAIFKWS